MHTHPILNPFDWAAYALVRLLGWFQVFLLVSVVRDPIWRTANGQTMRVRDMTDGHLHNAIRMIQRRPGEGSTVPLRCLLREQARRDERAFNLRRVEMLELRAEHRSRFTRVARTGPGRRAV